MRGADRPAAREGIQPAVELAWRAVSARARTEAELRSFLERRGIDPEAVDAAIAELRAEGYVDDAAYARRYVEDRRTLDRWGTERIARDLARRGVSAELVARAVAELDAGEREWRAARGLLEERFIRPVRDNRERDRAWRLLVRRGYAPELAYEAVRAHEQGAEDPSTGRRPGVTRARPPHDGAPADSDGEPCGQ